MLALARALARMPRLLLLDELSLGLAPVIVEWLLPVVRQFAEEQQCAVLLVEQHVHLALEVADRGYVLSHGEIVLQNDAEHLRADRQLLIASYLGEHVQPWARTPGRTRRRITMSHRSLEDLLATAPSPVELLRNSQAGPNVYPGVPAEYTNWRDEQTAWQKTCVLFNQSYHMADLAVGGPGRAEAAVAPRRQQLRGLRRRQGQALRALHPRRLRDRRRDPVLARREHVQPRRSGAGAQLDHATTRRPAATTSSVELDQRTALRNDGPPQVVPLPGPGPERDAGDREGARHGAAGAEVLQHDDGDDRGQDACARCGTAWRASPAGSCSARGTTARPCARRS